MNTITIGLKVWARINGKKIPATVLDYAFSAEGDYLQCKLEVEETNQLTGQVMKSTYPRPVQSYRLTYRGEKPVFHRSKRQQPAEVLKDIQTLLRQN